jgi:hypothetical protein
MKQIFLILCVLIALATVDHAQAFYKCTDQEGNSIITDNPPPDAICDDPARNKQSATGATYDEIQQIITTLNRLERKSIQGSLTSNEIEWQTQLLEDLSRSDTNNARRRIIKTLEILENKSIAGGLTKVERNQQKTLIQLQRILNNRPGKSTSETAIESDARQEEADIGVQNDEQKAKQTQQKQEIKRLFKIPRLGY